MRIMKSRQKLTRTNTKGFIVGRDVFAKISAVEGVKLTPEMRKDLEEFDRKGLSAKERRTAIVRKYAKPRET